MRREHFYRNKKAVKRSAAGAALAIFLALQITGCSQTADQNKADRKRSRPRGLKRKARRLRKAAQKLRKTARELTSRRIQGTMNPGRKRPGKEEKPVKQAGSRPQTAARQMQRQQLTRGTA